MLNAVQNEVLELDVTRPDTPTFFNCSQSLVALSNRYVMSVETMFDPKDNSNRTLMNESTIFAILLASLERVMGPLGFFQSTVLICE